MCVFTLPSSDEVPKCACGQSRTASCTHCSRAICAQCSARDPVSGGEYCRECIKSLGGEQKEDDNK